MSILLGLTTIAISVAHWDSNKNHPIYLFIYPDGHLRYDWAHSGAILL